MKAKSVAADTLQRRKSGKHPPRRHGDTKEGEREKIGKTPQHRGTETQRHGDTKERRHKENKFFAQIPGQPFLASSSDQRA